jgi:hypothetical protein
MTQALYPRCAQFQRDLDDSKTSSPVELSGSGAGSGSRATSLRQRIASLSAQIEELSKERDVAQAELDNISYPILTLPAE